MMANTKSLFLLLLALCLGICSVKHSHAAQDGAAVAGDDAQSMMQKAMDEASKKANEMKSGAPGPISEAMEQGKDKIGNIIGHAEDKVNEGTVPGAAGGGKDTTYEEMKKKLDAASTMSMDKANEAKDKIQEGINTGKDKAQQAFGTVKDKVMSSQNSAKNSMTSEEAKKAYDEAKLKASQMAGDVETKMKSGKGDL